MISLKLPKDSEVWYPNSEGYTCTNTLQSIIKEPSILTTDGSIVPLRECFKSKEECSNYIKNKPKDITGLDWVLDRCGVEAKDIVQPLNTNLREAILYLLRCKSPNNLLYNLRKAELHIIKEIEKNTMFDN